MSTYFVKGKGWRYNFILNGTRYTKAWFDTKKAAKKAEAEKRKEIENPIPEPETPTDTDFLSLANRRLDYVKSYNSEGHFKDVLYHSRRWVKEWKEMDCSEITSTMIEDYIIRRSKVSPIVANKDLQYLRALFNYGIKRKLISHNPTDQIGFLPVEKRKKYVPPKEDVTRVISFANPDTQHYLWTIVLTAGRVNEINNLTWADVSFSDRYLTLWTRKRKNGNREPREIPMVPKLHEILYHRYQQRDETIPWVFWHEYWCRKSRQWVKAPYKDRKKIMGILCERAGVKYFRYHALRHLTASVLDGMGIPIGTIQRILGHQNRRTTEIYLHSVGDAERKAMDRLQEVDAFSKVESALLDSPVNMGNTFYNRKVERPPFEVLKSEISKMGYSAVGRKYGVSDNAIRKWLKAYEQNQPRMNNVRTEKVTHRVTHKKKKGSALSS